MEMKLWLWKEKYTSRLLHDCIVASTTESNSIILHGNWQERKKHLLWLYKIYLTQEVTESKFIYYCLGD